MALLFAPTEKTQFSFRFCFDFVVVIVQLLFSAVLFIILHNVRSVELWLAGL